MVFLFLPDKNDRFASAGEALEFLGPGAVGAEIKPESATRRSGRTRNVLLAGAVAAVLILVVGLSFVFNHPSQKSSDIVPDSTAAVGIEPAAVKESGPAEKKSSPAEKDSGEKDGMKSAGDVATAKKDSIGISRAVGETVASAQVGSDSGYISIHCTPWAKIFIDNEYAGTTPIAGSVKMPVGMHTVTFNNPNFAPVVKQVDVRRNLLASAEANFLANSGYLIVSVEPWGNVYVDDQFRETTPSVEPIVVSSGTRKIRIHNPNFQDIVKTLTVNPGDTLRLNFSFLNGDGK